MRAILTLFLVTAVATATALEPPESYVEHQLRGANTEVHEDRDLLELGGSSASLAFSIASAKGAADGCFDYGAKCLELGKVFAATYVGAGASGNAFAIAFAEEYIWLVSICEAYAYAHAQSCAFTQVDGHVQVNTTVANSKKTVSMEVYLKAASTTFAMAASTAVAKAYTAVEAYSFTDVAAFCAKVDNKSPLCVGYAETELEQIAIAGAASVTIRC
jgi:hypothetical protein